MGTTTNLGLTTTDVASGSSITFLTFRTALAGTTSNMSILDNWAGSVSGSIISLSANEIIDVNASQISSNYYEATVSLISSYATNLKVNIKTNANNTGATTININGLGTKTLKKVNSSGTLVDLSSGDIVANSYNLFIYNGTYFVLIGALVGTSGSGTITGSYTGVSPITVTGSQISHAVSGVASGSYNQIIVDAKGHVTAGSFITITSGSGGGISSISGSNIMSDTSGSVVKHNISTVSPNTYLAANITIDQWGHITSAANGTSASSTGAPSDSPFVTSGSSASLTNARILTAGSNISIDRVSGSIIIHSTASSGSGAYATIWEPRANPSSSNAKDDEFSGSSLNAKWTIWDVGSCITSASPIENGLQIIPSLSNITKMAGIVQSAPSTPFTVWTKLQTNGFNGGLYWSLLVGANLIANPTSGSFYTGGLWNTGIGADWRVSYWDNYNNAFNRPLWSTSMGFPVLDMYVRARVSSTDIYYDLSRDGVAWYLTGTEGLAFTPAAVGLAFMNYDDTTFQGAFSVPFFRVTSGFGFNQIMYGDKVKFLLA